MRSWPSTRPRLPSSCGRCCAIRWSSIVSARAACAWSTRAARRASAISTTCSKATTRRRPPRSGPSLKFDVGRVEIEDLRATLRDEQGKLHGDVTLLSLTTGRIAPGIESPVELKGELALKQPALKGALAGKTRLAWNADATSLRLSDMKLAFKGDVPGASAVDAALRGALSWDGTKGALQARALELDLAATLGALKLAGSSVSVDSFAFDPGRKAIALGKLQLKLAGTQGQAPFSLALAWPSLEVVGRVAEGQRAERHGIAGRRHVGGCAFPVRAAER